MSMGTRAALQKYCGRAWKTFILRNWITHAVITHGEGGSRAGVATERRAWKFGNTMNINVWLRPKGYPETLKTGMTSTASKCALRSKGETVDVAGA